MVEKLLVLVAFKRKGDEERESVEEEDLVNWAVKVTGIYIFSKTHIFSPVFLLFFGNQKIVIVIGICLHYLFVN